VLISGGPQTGFYLNGEPLEVDAELYEIVRRIPHKIKSVTGDHWCHTYGEVIIDTDEPCVLA
jgi:hypothetical protein